MLGSLLLFWKQLGPKLIVNLAKRCLIQVLYSDISEFGKLLQEHIPYNRGQSFHWNTEHDHSSVLVMTLWAITEIRVRCSEEKTANLCGFFLIQLWSIICSWTFSMCCGVLYSTWQKRNMAYCGSTFWSYQLALSIVVNRLVHVHGLHLLIKLNNWIRVREWNAVCHLVFWWWDSQVLALHEQFSDW